MQHREAHRLEHSPYEALYQRYAPGLFAYAYQHTASREDAEDIVLDVFLSILQNKRFLSFDEQKQATWLWTITRNKIVDRHRRSTRHPQVSIEWLSETLFEDDQQAPEEVSLKHEAYVQLHQTLRALPAIQQEVLRLRFGHGLKCEEIAPVLEKSEGAVRMILFRALKYLRERYKNQGKGEKA
jgi:RNA polymerase sigma factor (sigma-70 family)